MADLSLINKDELAQYILGKLRDDVRDREEFGWVAMREYDNLSYDGYKGKAKEPWRNASNYAVGLTPTLLDTAHSNTVGSIFFDPNKVVNVRGIGPEDKRGEGNMSSLMNFIVLNDIEGSYDIIDKTVQKGFKHGNAAVKVVQGFQGSSRGKIVWSIVPIENLFLPIDAKGAQPQQADHIIELIPLTKNDIEYRKTLSNPDGSPIYEGLEDLATGNNITFSSAITSITNVKDLASGTSLGSRYSRDMFYIAECYLTYWQKMEDGTSVPYELIVTIAPNGGKIMRLLENTEVDGFSGEAVRPYSVRWIPYPRDDRFYGDSLPWLIKQTQEELDYAHNQVFNAIEKSIKAPTFYDPASGFDPETNEQVPNGWYPVPNPRNNVYIPTYDMAPILSHYRSFDLFWEYAQRRTGLTELFQGRQQERQSTLGEAELRVNKSEIRFATVYRRMEQGFRELMWLTYVLARKTVRPDQVVKILGTSDYQRVGEIFPQGLTGKYDFVFSSEPISERAKKRSMVQNYCVWAMTLPVVAQDPASQWGLLKLRAEVDEIGDVENYIRKPQSADIIPASEAIQRVVSGQYDFIPHPLIDVNDYLLKLNNFIRTDAFNGGDEELKAAITRLLRIVDNMRIGQMLAMQDSRVLQEGARLAAQGSVGGQAEPGSGQPQGLPAQGAA